MLDKVRAMLKAPVFDDEDTRRVASWLNSMVMISLLFSLVLLLILAFGLPSQPVSWWAAGILLLPQLGVWFLLHLGGVQRIRPKGRLPAFRPHILEAEGSERTWPGPESDAVYEALQKAEREKEIILDSQLEHVIYQDREHRILWPNRAACESAGLSREELIGQFCYEIWPKRGQRCDDCPVALAMESRREQEIEKTTPDGRVWFIRGYPVVDNKGEVVGGIEVTQEITERVRAEEALRQANWVVENSPVMFFRWRAAEGWPVELVSSNVTQLGYTPEEFLDQSIVFADIVHPQDRARVAHEVEDYSARGAGRFQQEYRVLSRNGETRWVDDRTLVERDGSGRITHYQGIIVDITERKQAEAERETLLDTLRRRSTQLQTAAQVSKSAITILDPDELVQQAVTLIQEHFDFYYVGLFLVDDSGEYAMLRAGTGEAGRRMMADGHKLAVGGGSMIGWCLAKAKPRVALDAGQETLRFDNPYLPETRSEMALPLLSRGRAIGALTVHSAKGTAFSKEDVTVLQSMADQLAIAIGNARSYAAARKELARRRRAEQLLQALNAAALAMQKSPTPQEIFAAVGEEFKKLGLHTAILMTDDSQNELFPQYFSYRRRAVKAAEKLLGVSVEGFSIPVDAADVFRQVIWDRQSLMMESAEAAFQQLLPETVKHLAGRVLGILGVSKFINAPLIVEDRVVGLLSVQSDDLIEDDVPAITAFAHQMAAAWHTARLFEQAQQEVERRQRAEMEIRQLNEELEQRVVQRTAELTAVNEELEAFAYSVSHDLRAPLRSIGGFSQALLEDYSGVLDEQGLDYLRRVQAGSRRMGQLIDDLLKLSRLTRGEMWRERVNLSAIARQIATDLQSTQPERQVEFIIPPQDLICNGDARLLRVVLENLLGNAWKFTSKRERARVEFSATEAKGRPIYFVRDDGVGFDMAYADKLFGAFQRLHSAAEFEGTGVGLATVQRIIHRHGGRVWAEAEVDRGATFFFTLSAKEGD